MHKYFLISNNVVYLQRCKKNRINEGTKSPLFLYKKMLEKRVTELLNEAFDERQDLYLISLTVSTDNSIRVIIDGDKGVAVEDCIFVSRAVEHNLDREEQDFSLEVMSAGATEPLINERQYKKHVGRTLKVKTDEQKLEGVLIDVSGESITLSWKTREPKPIGKGKITVQKTENVPFSAITQAKVVIKF